MSQKDEEIIEKNIGTLITDYSMNMSNEEDSDYDYVLTKLNKLRIHINATEEIKKTILVRSRIKKTNHNLHHYNFEIINSIANSTRHIMLRMYSGLI